jgi:hypothetical protein
MSLGLSDSIYRGRHLRHDDDDNVIFVVMTLLQALDQDFFMKSFSALVSFLDKCLSMGGVYVQK